MFTERELQLILDGLELDYGGLAVEIVRQVDLEQDVTSLREEQEELETLIDKVRDLFLEA